MSKVKHYIGIIEKSQMINRAKEIALCVHSSKIVIFGLFHYVHSDKTFFILKTKEEYIDINNKSICYWIKTLQEQYKKTHTYTSNFRDWAEIKPI